MNKTVCVLTALMTTVGVSALAAQESFGNEQLSSIYGNDSSVVGDDLTAIEPAAGEAEKKSFENLADAIAGGKVDLSFRYRIESVDDDAFLNDSVAGTLQSMLGYRTGTFMDTSAYVQVKDVSVIGSDAYNDTINGLTNRPVIADPDATEVDQAYLDFGFVPDTRITVGRRKLMWGNQRYISALGWRQNNNSFDGVVVENTSLPDTKFSYAFANNINRAFTDKSTVGNFDDDTRVHLFNAEYAGLPIGKLTGYGYLLDLDGFAAAAGMSSETYGVNLTGKKTYSDVDFLYIAEYARQSDYGSNPTNFDANYFRIEPGVSYAGFTVKAGYEELGSDNGVIGFSTPLALLHAYNGWADKFTNTPANGLQDTYASAAYAWKGTGKFFNGGDVQFAYHDFDADHGGASYGKEWDAAVGTKFLGHYNASVKFANYNADTFGADTQKMWFVVGAEF